MNFLGVQTGIERKALEDNLANRRTPRMFSTANLTVSPAIDYHLDFCQWLQSNEFGNNRRALIEGCGGHWMP